MKFSGQEHVLAVNKPTDWTSFDVVKKIRNLSRIKKVGHAGTLDPFATGLLLICTGSATKKISQLMKLPKVYDVEITLGSETDTMDFTGEVICTKDVPVLSKEEIYRVISAFKGETEQEIPKYSAAKYKGQRLYKMARKGKEVPQLFKKVTIYDIELLSFGGNKIEIRVECAGGTYMRTLARDICRALNTAGHVSSLVRTRIGDFTLEDALTIDDLIGMFNKPGVNAG